MKNLTVLSGPPEPMDRHISFPDLKTLIRLAIMAAILVSIVIFVFAVFGDKRPSVFFAATDGDTNVLSNYLESADVNKLIVCYPAGHRYASLLHVAVSSGQSDAAAMLLKAGAKVNVLASDKQTPLLWLLGKSKNSVPDSQRFSLAKMLLDAGADPDTRDRYGNTALSLAARWNQDAIVDLLVRYKANVNATNLDGETPLSVTTNVEIIKILLKGGAFTNK